MKKFVFFLISAISLLVQAADRPTVQVQTGLLQGVVERNMQVFKNIPYAAPPVGELRWRPPQAPLNWSGTRDASQFGLSCPQPYIKNLSAGLGLPRSEEHTSELQSH